MNACCNRLAVCAGVLVLIAAAPAFAADPLREQAEQTLKKAATYYRTQVASHGGYVYHYSPDLSRRWGEGVATADQIWVQPPGTPTVGLAYLAAYNATGDTFYLEAATAAAEALIYGQLESGGWTNSVDFNPQGSHVAQYRNGKGRGKNYSSLDDGQTQSALRFLFHIDQAHKFQNAAIHEAALTGLKALLNAQFPNGAFPQVWAGPVSAEPMLKANYPDYDWRTEGRIKEYWNMYTLNDDLAGYVSDTLIGAHTIYDDKKPLDALLRLGDFLLIAQMPEPQPAWAQQYNYQMQPIWARKFEPPGVSGRESQDAMDTLLKITRYTNNPKYLEPIPRALAYLKKSQLPDGRLARYYALKTNRPLYMFRRGKVYSLTYDDSDLPDHYGWKTESRLDQIARQYQAAKQNKPLEVKTAKNLEPEVRKIIKALDDQGRWMSHYTGERLVGQPKFKKGEAYLSSAVFSHNMTTLSEYLIKTK